METKEKNIFDLPKIDFGQVNNVMMTVEQILNFQAQNLTEEQIKEIRQQIDNMTEAKKGVDKALKDLNNLATK